MTSLVTAKYDPAKNQILDPNINGGVPAFVYDANNNVTGLQGLPITRAFRSFVCLGDSLTLSADTNQGHFNSFPFMMEVLSKGGMRLLRNAGLFGDRSDGFLSRVATQVIPYRPDICFVEGFTNDSLNGYSTATTLANLAAIKTALWNAGTEMVFIQAPPLGSSAGAFRASQETRNAACRAWCERNRVKHINPWEFVTDPATGWYLSGSTADQIHPNNTLYATMAQTVINSMAIPASVGSLSSSPVDAANMVTNPFFLNGTTLPTGWSDISGTNNATIAIAAPSGWTQTPMGNCFTISQAGTGTGIRTVRALPAAVAGRLYRFSCRFKSVNCLATGFQYGAFLQAIDSGFSPIGTGYRPVYSWSNDMEGVIRSEFVADANAAYISVGLYGSNAGATAGGSVSFSQVCLEDMTANGFTPSEWPWL